MIFKNPFKKRSEFLLKEGHKVSFAFTCAGIDYFEFDDAFNIPAERCHSAMSFYEELNMKCTREFLQAHTTAVHNILSNPKQIDLPRIMKLNAQLQERLDFIFDHEIALKLASVVYFDKSENPYSYDFGYGYKKIAIWKKEMGLDFFLSKPMIKLVPFLNSIDLDLKSYTEVAGKINREHLENISMMLSEADKTKSFFKILDLQQQVTSL